MGESSLRDNEFTKEQIKGIDVVIKSLQKQYPFVKSWKFANDWEKYATNLYIDLIVDVDLVSKFFDLKIENYVDNGIKSNKKIEMSSIYGFLDTVPMYTDEWEKQMNDSYKLKKEMINFMNILYVYIYRVICVL